MDHIDLSKYLAIKERETGRPRYDAYTLLKVILFAFMERGYVSTREIVKLCKTDIRFMWLLQDNSPPSHMTIDNFMNQVLKESIEEIFTKINSCITRFHQEVLENLNSVQGATLRMNRSIQAEGAYASIKWNRSYTRARRRGLKSFLLEIGLISIGFNLHKLHLRRAATPLAA